MKKALIAFVAFLIFSFSQAFASDSSQVYLKDFLLLFKNSPEKALNKIPPKYNKAGQRLQHGSRQFSQSDISNFKYVDIKDQHRQSMCPNAQPGEPCQIRRMSYFSAIDSNNDLRLFFSLEPIYKKLERLNIYQQAKTKVAPWSGDYWPTYRGGISARYNEPQFPISENFKDYYDFHEKNKAIDISNSKLVDNLSPAEKYDLLINDSAMSLTNYSISEAYYEWKSSGKVETWFGICHGWAPASYMMKRPLHSVDIELKSRNTTLRFYPDDLKALESLIWANAAPETRMLGGRCNDKDPKRDEIGRIISPNCFDINPGAWHMAVINQVGQFGRSMVIDATYDYEVWNQPVVDYSFTYFNPVNRRLSRNLKDVVVDVQSYQNDPFKKYRDAKTKSIVGVSMELTYAKETDASHQATNSPKEDYNVTVQYVYDLEIDQNGEVIGGEWYQNAHPDFIWTAAPGSRALSNADRSLNGEWTTNQEPPQDWSAKLSESSHYGQPSAKILEHLVELAQ